MTCLLSCTYSAALISVILFSTGLLLPRKASLPVTLLSFLPFATLLLFLDFPAASWPWNPSAFPYPYLLLLLPAFVVFAGTAAEKLFVFLCQVVAACTLSCAAALAAGWVLPLPGEAREAIRLCFFLGLGALYLRWTERRGSRLFKLLFSKKDGWAWTALVFGPCLLGAILPMAFAQDHPPTFFPLILLFAVWSVSLLVLSVMALLTKCQLSRDLEFARSMLKATTTQADEMAKMVEASRMLRHDCKHHLHVAQMLLETGHLEEARSYLMTFGAKCNEGVLTMYCSDPTVNALLTGYEKRSKECGIAFFAAVDLPKEPPMDSFELCTLLGNLLENALEACKKAPQDQRRIVLKGVSTGGQLKISVKNSFDGAVLQEAGHIISRKGEAGGLGIKSIRAIAARHQGEYVPTWEGHTFSASVVLKL